MTIGQSAEGPMMRIASLVLLITALALAACSQAPLAAQTVKDGDSMPKLAITVGDKTFVATLLDHATARAFTALLPMSVTMEELNGNEKFYRLPSNLPAQASIPPSIRAGELNAVRLHYPDAPLRVVLDALQLHEDRAGRRRSGPEEGTRFGKRHRRLRRAGTEAVRQRRNCFAGRL